jgi:DNA-binding NtrC family response regulator
MYWPLLDKPQRASGRSIDAEEVNKGKEMSKQARGGGKVLLVEGPPHVGALIEAVLREDERYEVRRAQGVEEGVRALREERFGVVVLDVCDMEQEEAHRCIEEMVREAGGTPVGVRVMKEEGVRERGVAFVVGHPFDMNKLVQQVERAMSGQAQP